MLCLKRAHSFTTLSSAPHCTYSPCLLLLSQLLPYFPTAPFRECRCIRTGVGVRAEILASSSLKDSPLAFSPHFFLLVPTLLLRKINVSNSAKSCCNADTSNIQDTHWVRGTWQSPSSTCFISKYDHCQGKALCAISRISKTFVGYINAGTDPANKPCWEVGKQHRYDDTGYSS